MVRLAIQLLLGPENDVMEVGGVGLKTRVVFALNRLGVYCTSGSERRRSGFSTRPPNFNCIVLGAQKELDGQPQHFYISNNLYNPSVTFLDLQNKI